MDRNQRLTLIVGILVIILLVVAYYVFLLGPLREQYAQRVDERENKQAQLSQLQGQVKDLEDLQRRAPEIERQLLELSKRVPEQAQIPTLIVQIQEIAKESKVTQLSIEPGSPEPPPGGGDYQRVPVTMTFEGTYVQMQDFLRRIRNLVRLMSVNEVTYQLASSSSASAVGQPSSSASAVARPGSGNQKLQVEISAEVYVQPTSGSSGPAPVTPPPVTTPESTTEETTGGG